MRKDWRIWDIALAVLAVILLVTEAVIETDADPVAIGLGAVIGGSLAFRRTYPLSSYAVSGVAVVTMVAVAYPAGNYVYANLLHVYSVGAYARPSRSVVGLVLALAGPVSYWLVAPPDPNPVIPAIVVAGWVLAWAAGAAEAARRRRSAAEALEEEEAERKRQAEALAAADEERSRIVREVHDIVGHSVTVMLLHAGAAQRLLHTDPVAAATAVNTVEEVGRGTLGELDRVLGLQRRDSGGAGDRRPAPGIDDIGDLAGRFNQAGISVRVEVEGEPRALSRSIDLAVYRIVQESLTNVARHAGGAPAEVRIRYAGNGLRVVVSDSGKNATPGNGGRGLAGIRERVEELGGELTAGPGPEGGWTVDATIPLQAS
jgi:signal transduction histidine kinase